MSIAISSIVDNGDGTATLTWTGADGGNVNVLLASHPDYSFTVVNSGSTSASGTATFPAPPGVNWAQANDLLSLNFHETPITRFVMNAAASAGDGPLLSPLVNLAQMVAASPTFLTACGLDPMDPNSPLVALGQLDGTKRIFYPEVEDSVWQDVTTLFPLCVIDFGASPRHASRVSAGGMNYLRPDGGLHMILAQDDQAPGNVQESKAAFARFVGKVLGDVEALAGLSSNLDIVETEIMFGPFCCSQTEQTARNGKLYWWTQIEIKWGRA